MNKLKIPLKNRKKLLATLIICILVPTLIFTFQFKLSPASARWIEKSIFYDVKNQYWNYPPVVGLDVTLGNSNGALWTHTTNSDGCVIFGSGLPDGAYWISYTFAGKLYNETVTIDCSQIMWEFTNYVPAKEVGSARLY